MPSTFLDFTGLSHFLDHLKVLITQSNWQQTDSTEMEYIKNKPTISVSGQTLVMNGWGNSSTGTSYTVTFMMNDGTQTIYDTQTVTSGNTASAPATNPTRTDYSFNGWYEDSAGTTAFSFSTPITADKTLYAKWTAQSSGGTATITFAQNLANQQWQVYSSDSSFQIDYGTMTATVNQGATVNIQLVGYSSYTAGNVIVDGVSTGSSNYSLTVSKASYTVTASDAEEIIVVLGNYQGSLTVGSTGDTSGVYTGAVGYDSAPIYGSLLPTAWGEFSITRLALAYGNLYLEISGNDSDRMYAAYAKMAGGTLTIGNTTIPVNTVAVNGMVYGNVDVTALHSYLVSNIGNTIAVSFSLPVSPA